MDRHWNAREKDFAVGGVENGTFQLATLAGEVLQHKVNGFRLKPYLGPTPPNPFHAIKETAEEFTH